MSAGGAAWSQSSRLMLFGGERPATFHVATNILLQAREKLSTVLSLGMGMSINSAMQ
jgi:hypothetical protein